ncbi:MAG: hypothetical protein ABSG33_02785 [Candidatus Bathyarchaeia archaeon]
MPFLAQNTPERRLTNIPSEATLISLRLLGESKGLFAGLPQRVDGVFYRCEYINQCGKVTRQCWQGGNSYCSEYKKSVSQKKKKKLSSRKKLGMFRNWELF